MKAIVLGATLLALVATSACKRDHRDQMPSQTTTTGAHVPARERVYLGDAGGAVPLRIMNTGTTTTTESPAPADSAAPAEPPRGTDFVPRSASEAQQRRDEGPVGPFGPSFVPAPVAPTSPAEKAPPK